MVTSTTLQNKELSKSEYANPLKKSLVNRTITRLPITFHAEYVHQSRMLMCAIISSIIGFTAIATAGIILAATIPALSAFVPLATVLPVVMLPIAVHFISKIFKQRAEEIAPKVKYYEAVCEEFNKIPATEEEVKLLLIKLKLASDDSHAGQIVKQYDNIDQVRAVIAYYLAGKTLLAKTADKVKNLEFDILNFPKVAEMFVENLTKTPTDKGFIKELQISKIPMKILQGINPYLSSKDKEKALAILERTPCEAGHKEVCESILKEISPKKELTSQERKFRLNKINNYVIKGAKIQLYAAFFQMLLSSPQTSVQIDDLVQWNSDNLSEIFTSYYMNNQLSQGLSGSIGYDLYTMPKTKYKWSDFWRNNIKQNSLQGFSSSMLSFQTVQELAEALKKENSAK